MQYLQPLIANLFFAGFFVSGNEHCPSPPFKENAKSVLKIFGFSDSCTSTALEWCDHECPNDFPSAISDSEKSIAEAALALENALNVLKSLSACLKKADSAEIENEATTTTIDIISQHCDDVKKTGDTESGIRTIFPYSNSPEKPISVYCDQATNGGGWTVIQRRENLPVRENFYRNWTEYSNGFGDLTGEFWLGLDNIHELTSLSTMVLRIELENEKGEKRYAEYDNFKLGDASTKYKLISVGKFTGDAGDSLSDHNGMMFSTHNEDNDFWSDGNCAEKLKAAWWFTACYHSNLNGFPYVGKTSSTDRGILWIHWTEHYYSLSKAIMMIRLAESV